MEQIKDKIERVLSKLVNPPNNTKKIVITPINSIKHLPDINSDNQRYEYIMFQKSFDKIIRRNACKTVPSFDENTPQNSIINENNTSDYGTLSCNNGCGIRSVVEDDHAYSEGRHRSPEKYDNNNNNDNNTLDFNVYLKMFIHELRTPISTISMGLDLIKLDSSATKNSHNVYTIRNLKKSIQFIEDIFSKFSVIQEGNIELNTFVPFSLNALLLNVTHLLKYHLQEGNVFFQYDIHPDVYDWVYGDMYNLKHCIINLLKNAIKYKCPHRSSVITIDIYKTVQPATDIPVVVNKKIREMEPHPPTVSKHDSGSYRQSSLKQSRKTLIKQKQPITISIKDNNDPILPHIKERLFESFNSTSGSGLGLYICKNIIELHGGNINHLFIEPEGNEFFINLNMELCEDTGLQISNKHNNSKENSDNSKENSDNSKENSNHNSGERISEKSTINIIIIDDSLLNRKLLYKLLKSVNKVFTIYTAINGKDTINRKEFIINHICILFLDKYMPLMSGIEVAKELRESGYKHLIIGLTGEDNETTNKQFLENGADIVFIKPLDISKIKMINEFIMTYGTDRQEKKTIQIVDNKMEWSEG
jgi:nitrogen-specific signal transduction histidine kinase/CheY-like chemotaxis protein